ncbi:FKBP-type peptidyl-prolyl cis-trans isomerase [Luteimonas aestuarii]|uniref:Peptidyl-prolyl cis-trans isomerase n=1 Tax=Luteimonas aestuarii TaxID=453837 RepID=A0A4R5TLN5_9GAMM|nr:FKBP-type peptidyl-prolyl cis-trans isomerase [Luteimonas aestuarii]TDK22487.1 FKBP-type peptidyl-prolyl cis-trans isomerase [Luteimonas aestuarii]
MTSFLRGTAALLCAAVLALPLAASAADKTSLDTDRDRTGYMIGMDVGRSLAPVAPDMDVAAFERAVRHAFEGGEPLLGEADAAQVGPALMQRVAARGGQRVPGLAPGATPPPVDKAKVGLLMGADVGRSLAPIQREFDVATFMQAVRTTLAGGTPLLSPEQFAAAGEAFQKHMQQREARAGEENRQAGLDFLAGNRTTKGVVTTASGLQYQVLRQGSGRRPMATDRVRVHYRGTLLDGTVFDSSYDRGQAADFGLRQVIPGWTEGLALMPIGGRYRFWIPSDLAYGTQGRPPTIGPNSVLVFDVELLDIL